MKRLENKTAVIYGDGAVGSAVAIAYAGQGAKVYIAGRTPEKLASIAEDIKAAGGFVETAVLDVLEEAAVEKHMHDLIGKEGKIDISFNTIGIPQKGIQGIALTDLSLESFSLPINIYTKAHFITSRMALREMIKQGSGVILMHTPNASRISPPFVGGMVPAWSAIEGLCRSISVEYGQMGIRSVCFNTTGMPETPLIDEVWEIHGKAHGISFQDFHAVMEGMTHRRKLTTLAELTGAAIFVASDEGSAITGTNFNLTAGMII
ncbi:SDR family NAD(P)-dependent oxidoreductase [Mucilaginibacter segetis]|uniref:SDR family oxidoreductase n=1 Tax=Mucilaginibacter segetis TaxID=2793071 RepID=A0A934PPQ1_9SPHI|nr:SDR family oxidoreductase [Mucilaginibacter segetis]MBK0378454.1 SDR family oxidoreductase [Mucilaginibacter segetis]